MTIAWVFYSAISIYLSGTYDYSRLWNSYGIPTPILGQTEIQQDVNNILHTTSHALKQTNVTGLLFLFPLSIAGARAVTIEQRKRIHALLAEITGNFRAANAFTSDLQELWANPESKCNVTAER
jgi:Fungal specific transcription factor domain